MVGIGLAALMSDSVKSTYKAFLDILTASSQVAQYFEERNCVVIMSALMLQTQLTLSYMSRSTLPCQFDASHSNWHQHSWPCKHCHSDHCINRMLPSPWSTYVGVCWTGQHKSREIVPTTENLNQEGSPCWRGFRLDKTNLACLQRCKAVDYWTTVKRLMTESSPLCTYEGQPLMHFNAFLR